ncbi:NAD-dependent epimerase/dehydratase family protein [Mucilaginibacter segetis]|uniref:NAD(P)-dependent oxidoreductase n=1 Tax=Mucilaginibacter segetis TaxID=2793071 RepID=A0A934PXD8_9SPHI|nr:NAD(P)-dependent oxidoreductase [Mucilaginibacter segetis]MBK0381135.1 NAD(P)-dependent oxidoreductase [Mucilaginibacter segetis]
MARIFLTGITGFLGSNIAQYLVSKGHEVIATYRPSSSRDLCLDFFDTVTWILQDENDLWVNHVVDLRPEIVIHSAWIGVSHGERNNWDCQYNNVEFLTTLLNITKCANATKFIGLGSQAEYGVYNDCIDENAPLNVSEAYGSIKIICSEIVKQFCNYHHINWYWLRLFSFFGKGESDKWLISALIKRMALDDHMDLTPGEQKYAYLYVNDLGLAINNIVVKNGKSGIYNISSKSTITIKYLIESIRDIVKPTFKLNFGILPYRSNQSMHIQGDSSKFINEFGDFELSDFNDSLLETVEYLKGKFNTQKNESI